MKNKVLIGIIIVLVGVIIAEGVYLFTNKEDRKENNSSINIPKEEEEENESNDNETSEDYVKLVNTKEEDNQVIQEYEMVLNGEYQEFEIVFENTSNDDTTEVIGKFKDIQVYTYMLPYFDNEFNFDNVKDDLNSNNFQIISGIDKNYLAIIGETHYVNGDIYRYYFLDSNYHLMDRLVIFDWTQTLDLGDKNVWYSNSLSSEQNSMEYQLRSKVEGNKIYNLYNDCSDILEERVYTINNDKLEYEIINTYQILSVYGSVC